MGIKIKNTYYSDREIWEVLERKGYQRVPDEPKSCMLMIILSNDEHKYKTEDAHEAFERIVKRRLNQTKQQFLDSL